MLPARVVLNAAEMMLRESMSADELDAMLHPPSRDEERAERIYQLRELGVELG